MRKITAGLFISLDGVVEALEGDLVEAVTALRNEPGGNIALSGSVSVVRQLLAAGLLDDLQLLVHPVAVRKGLSDRLRGVDPAMDTSSRFKRELDWRLSMRSSVRPRGHDES
jgi:dihydrofolate reductase